MSGVQCHISGIYRQLSPILFHMSLMPTTIAADPPPANSSTMHKRLDN